MFEPKTSVLIVRENMLYSRDIYTTGKNFTLPPAVTALTNLTSGTKLCIERKIMIMISLRSSKIISLAESWPFFNLLKQVRRGVRSN